MASKTQKTEAIRARKHKPNTVNLKKVEKQLQKNMEVLDNASEAK